MHCDILNFTNWQYSAFCSFIFFMYCIYSSPPVQCQKPACSKLWPTSATGHNTGHVYQCLHLLAMHCHTQKVISSPDTPAYQRQLTQHDGLAFSRDGSKIDPYEKSLTLGVEYNRCRQEEHFDRSGVVQK